MNKWVKPWLLIIICCLSVVVLGACTTVEARDNSDSSYVSSSSSSVKETSKTRTVTLSASYFNDDLTSKEIAAIFEEKGYSEVTVNTDGSTTITMPEETYDDLVSVIDAKVIESLEDISKGKDYPGITSVDYSSDYTKITMISSNNPLHENAAHVGWSTGLTVNMYQQIAGQKLDCTITIYDTAGQVIQTERYPNDFDVETKESITKN